MITLSNVDYYRAGIADCSVEGLDHVAIDVANRLSVNGESFFYAVQGAVMLNDVIKEMRK